MHEELMDISGRYEKATLTQTSPSSVSSQQRSMPLIRREDLCKSWGRAKGHRGVGGGREAAREGGPDEIKVTVSTKPGANRHQDITPKGHRAGPRGAGGVRAYAKTDGHRSSISVCACKPNHLRRKRARENQQPKATSFRVRPYAAAP